MATIVLVKIILKVIVIICLAAQQNVNSYNREKTF